MRSRFIVFFKPSFFLKTIHNQLFRSFINMMQNYNFNQGSPIFSKIMMICFGEKKRPLGLPMSW